MARTEAIAERVYVDPSALLKLYLHEPESRAMVRWRSAQAGPVAVTYHGRAELTNAVCLARFRGIIDAKVCDAALEALDEDFKEGRCVHADVLWRATLRRATELSRVHTPILGTRALDVLHVASAVELGFTHFLTCDVRQQSLAKAAGLRLVRLHR